MTQAILSGSASSAPTKIFEKVIGEAGKTTSLTRCQVFSFEAYSAPQPQAHAGHSSISELVTEWEQDTEGRNALEEGRRWMAETFYSEDGDTIRTLRLRKGWSQARLAEELGTSQPYIARIEQGAGNMNIETCRKLSRALGIDLNTLDQALRHQDAIAQAKQT